MTETRFLSDLTLDELQEQLARAKDDAKLAQYADSLTPKRKADERIDAIKAEIARRWQQAAQPEKGQS